MLLNYLKLSFRLMARNPFFTFINVAGLSVGFAVFYVLWQYSTAELKSDQQWKDWQRIARLGGNWEFSDDGRKWGSIKFGDSAPYMAPLLSADYPELESFTRIMYRWGFGREYTPVDSRIVVTVENTGGPKHYSNDDKTVCADMNVFDFFSIPLLAGDAASALQKVNSVVLSKSLSKKYFGVEPALGKTILLNNQLFEVTGVFQDLPHNTHMDFEMVISNQSKLSSWASPSEPNLFCMVFFMGRNATNWQNIEDRINQPAVIQKYTGEVMKSVLSSKWTHKIEPLREIAFSEWGSQGKPTQSRTMLVAFQMIGIVVLLLAVINYIILTTAKTRSRLKEVAARKVTGAGSVDFFKQFLAETCMMFGIAIVLAFTWVQLLKVPLQVGLQIVAGKPTPDLFVMLGIATLISIAICSAYPTYMSVAFQPRVLLTKALPKRGGRGVSLTLFQYGTSVVLIVFSFALYKQITFLLKKNLGFKKDDVVVMDAPVVRTENYENEIKAFVNKIMAEGKAEMATVSKYAPGYEGTGIDITVRRSGNQVSFDSNGGVDENFIPFYDLKLIAGRNFLPDENGGVMILSEGALVRLGFADAEDAIGAIVNVLVGDSKMEEGWKKVEIIGVMKEYRLRPFVKLDNVTLDDPNRGIGLTYRSALIPWLTAERISIRLITEDVELAMASIGKEYEAVFPGNVFNWHFLDERISNQYTSEKILNNQLVFFTSLAIGIACLGLLGMISNKAVEKNKEIGIRKVLGARLYQIARMLLTTTVKQVSLAAVIGVPAAYYLSQEYLQKFSERIELQWWHYALPVMLLILIMLATVAAVVWKAAKGNPAEALKYE